MAGTTPEFLIDGPDRADLKPGIVEPKNFLFPTV